ncbi:C-Maf-inducing protein-like [Gigantopelta aegis]|uniref:C-Maf-inducing protein-like n=1 Tax=Gigantopelta aegis TaxID=1735272 RepID=UPI001B888D56|nr:C-Maf-inducing protein-like [Gigantopelta aegis]
MATVRLPDACQTDSLTDTPSTPKTPTHTSGNSSPGSTNSSPISTKSSSLGSVGPKYKLVTDGDIQVCRLNHTRTIVSKIMNSKYLRRWESHHVLLDHSEIRSLTPYGFMEMSVPYSSIEDVHIISRWDAGQKFCIRITIQDGSLLLQANNGYLRDQWLFAIQWKKHMYKYEKLLKSARRPEVLVKEIKQSC